MDRSISFCTTAFREMRKASPGALLRAAIDTPLKDDRIQEIVICNDASDDYDELVAAFGHLPKVKLYQNEQNYGVFGNKLSAIRRASHPWAICLDTDNAFGPGFLDRLWAEDWQPDVMLCPGFAKPRFDYRAKGGVEFGLRQFSKLLGWPLFGCMLNTGNQFLHVDTFRSVLQLYSPLRLDHQQPFYFEPNFNPNDRRWLLAYDAADSIFFNKLWLLAGKRLRIVSGLEYEHGIQGGGAWERAPEEKEVIPAIYVRELEDVIAGGPRYTYMYAGQVRLGAKNCYRLLRRHANSGKYVYVDPGTYQLVG